MSVLIIVLCLTIPAPPELIMGSGLMSSENLVSFFLQNNTEADPALVSEMALCYVDECAIEGVNSDIAFIQMCLETGFLRFQGLVGKDMNNFCGLGAIDASQPGASFPNMTTGVRAHVQHLKAYGSTEPLVQEQADPRFHYVTPRGKAPDIFSLSGTWAADRNYGTKLFDLLERLYSSAIAH